MQQQIVILPFVIHESRGVILFQKQNSFESNTLATLPAVETANAAEMSMTLEIGCNAFKNKPEKQLTYLSRPDDQNSKIIQTFRYHYLSIQENQNYSSVVVCLLKY